MDTGSDSRITVADFESLLEEQAPFVRLFDFRVETIEHGRARVAMPFKPEFIRPGGSISGPAIMSLADITMYAVVLSLIGRVELAVTTSLNCNFLRRPKPGAVIADCRLIKLGKRLAYGEVSLYSEGDEDAGPVAHVTATYSIPPERGKS